MLIELLREAPSSAADRALVLSPAGSLSYAECVSRSEALARDLRARSLERFACLVRDQGQLLCLLMASSAIGSEACVYPHTLSEALTSTYASELGHRVLVTDQPLVRGLPLQTLSLGQLGTDEGVLRSPPRQAPVLILTSGTTGRQRAARHDWGRLIASARYRPAPPGARCLLAYNLSQFGGIQVMLHTMLSQATLVVPRSRAPQDVLAAIREWGVTHTSGTPTFWRMLMGVLDHEAAATLGVEQITLSGEAVPASLLERLQSLFPAARISQVYASSEFGSAVSVTDGRSGLPLSVLERSEDADVQFRIVDGELQARSRVGMLGYQDEKVESEEWRPTGDLVEIRGDRIQFVGRSNETINVGGVKIHPFPVEELVSALDGVKLVRAYGRPNPVTGQIVAVEVVPSPGIDTGRLEQEIRAACAALPPASQPRRIRFVPTLELRGEKIARRQGVIER